MTATIVEWIPVFIGPEPCQILVDSLDYCRKQKGMRLYAYVVMDNHVHLVAEAPDLSRVIQSFKRHTARRLLEWIASTNRTWLASQLEFYCKRHKAGSEHQVWQEGSHPQLIQNDAMLREKIAYIHNNPVRRGYVDVAEHWRLSSARNYTKAGIAALEIDAIPW